MTINTAHLEYLFWQDAKKAKNPSPDLIVMVFNGLDYYAPTAIEIATITCECTQASTHISDAIVMIKGVIKDLPNSTVRESLTKSLCFMGAANSQLQGTSLITGTTCTFMLPKEVLIPKASTAKAVVKTAHKRVAASLGEVPPKKRSNESSEVFTERKKKYAETVAKFAKRDTKLGANQCPCSVTFNSMQALLEHQANDHPDKRIWKCAHCPSISNSKGHLWTHAQKHLGKYYHYCDIKYKDPKKKNKEIICEKGCDEIIGMEFHPEMEHKVGRCSCHCDYCDKPQISVC